VKETLSLRGNPAVLFMLLLIAIFIYGGMETSAAGFFNSLFTQALSAPSLGAYAISSFWLAMMLSRVLFGLLRLPAKWVVLVCSICCAASYILLSVSHTPYLSLLLCALAGVTSGPIWVMLVSFAAKEFPAFSGTAASLMSTGSGLGATLVPVAVGWTAERFSQHLAMLLIGLLMVASSLVFSEYIRRKKRND
jgi:FHS family glucose/mannose:H+ symporter-like MFS transporter